MNTWSEIAIWFIVIFFADLCCEGFVQVLKKWRKKAADRVICEMCQKPRKIRLTRDGKVKACRTCRKLYVESLKQEVVDGTS